MQKPLPLAEEHPLAGDPDAHRRLQAIGALLACPSYREAAEAAAVDRTALSRWIEEPPFQHALAAARRDLQNQALDAVLSANAAVTDLFVATARDPQAPAPTRVRAAAAVVRLSHGARQSRLQRRMAHIGHAVQARQAPVPPVSSIA